MKTRLLFLLFVLINAVAFGQLKINAVGTNTTCQRAHGHNLNGINIGTGKIKATATGGQPPYTFSIAGNYTTPRSQNNGYFPQLFTATYKVSVTDINGLYSDTSITIAATLPIPNIDYPILGRPSGCSTTDGTISLHTLSGTPPFLFSLDGGSTYSTDSVFKNLTQGFYMCDVLDGNQCMSFSWEGYINSPAQCKITSGQDKVLSACNNDADQEIVYVYPTTDSAIQISYDGINYRKPNFGYWKDTVSNWGGGVHLIYLKDTITGETARSAITVGKSCVLYITFISTDASCQQNDGTLTVMATGGTPPYTYTLDGDNYQTSNVFTGLASGGYTVTVMDVSGAIYSGVGTVSNKCPAVTLTEMDETCGGKNGTIKASAVKGTKPYLFSIDGTNFQTDSIFTGLAPGKYTVTIKDALGYKDSTAITVSTVCIQIQVNVGREYCNNKNGSIILTASGGYYPYQYSFNGGPFQSNSYLNNLGAGTYTYTVMDAKGSTKSGTAIVTDTLTGPNVNLGNDTTLCAGQTLKLVLSNPNTSYHWQNNSTDSFFTITSAGKYWVVASNKDCTARDTINVQYLSLGIGNIFQNHDTTTCIGNTITLNAGHTGATFLWDDNSTNQTRTVNTDGKYWVKVSNSSCSASDTIACHFVPGPIIVFPSDTSLCNTRQLILNAGNINATYLWNDGSINSTLVVTKAGTYTVAATANGCTTHDTIKVTIKPNPQIALGNDTTLCTGQTVMLNATAQNPIGVATYFWQDGTTSPFYTVNKKGSYSVTVLANGCDTTGKITINYNAKPVVNIGVDTTLCNADKLVLNATYPQSSYLWQDGSSKPSFTVTTAGIYSVDVTNYCGTVKDSITVQYENCDCVFYIPSAFSPNGDGKNDVFKPSYKCFFTDYRLNIFSRFGKIVFSSTNADTGWDGMINGQQQPTGVYVWEISYFDTFTNKPVKKTGTMMLLR